MESQMIDYYNEESQLVRMIDKINKDFEELQSKYDELLSNHKKLQLTHEITNVNIKKLKKDIHNTIVKSPNHRHILSRKGLNWFWGKTPKSEWRYNSQGELLYISTLDVKYTQ
jgi:hypothetical protein